MCIDATLEVYQTGRGIRSSCCFSRGRYRPKERVMNCHRCGNTLPPNARACPQCDRPHAKTKVLSESDVNKTRALVHLDRCQNCGFMVFPADTECASCGAWIDRGWQKPVKS